MHEDTVGVWMSEPEVQDQVLRLKEVGVEVARRMLHEAAADAAETFVEFARGDIPARGAAIRLKASAGVLDRVGVAAAMRLEGDDPSLLSLEELARRAKLALAKKKP